jgi:periplasmic divalent cation tolerance protein
MTTPTTDVILVLTTVPTPQEAQALAETLVEQRLAACVSISGPMRSIYRWQGSVDRNDEHQVIIKTQRSRLAELEARITTLHSYDLPEILVLPVESGSAAYLNWVTLETREPVGE